MLSGCCLSAEMYGANWASKGSSAAVCFYALCQEKQCCLCTCSILILMLLLRSWVNNPCIGREQQQQRQTLQNFPVGRRGVGFTLHAVGRNQEAATLLFIFCSWQRALSPGWDTVYNFEGDWINLLPGFSFITVLCFCLLLQCASRYFCTLHLSISREEDEI